MRIAAHISASEWGGAERRSLALLAGLQQRGHRVLVYCNTSFTADRARDSGLTATVVPLGGDVRVGDAVRLARELRRYPPDVLILVTFRRLWLGALAGRIARVPRIIARVGMDTDVARNAKYRFVLKRWIDDVVLNAQSMRRTFEDALPPGAGVRLHVVPNGVAEREATMSRADARSALGLPGDAWVVGTVARLVSQKRLDRLLRAFALLDGEPWLVVVGEGSRRVELEALARQLGVTKRVRWAGHREDVGNVLRALDAYAVTSDKEGMSSAMLEALAAGLPVVSTPVSGAAEALAGEPVCGIIAEPDPAAVAKALRQLQQDSARCAELSRNARDVVLQRYGLDRMIDAWHALLGPSPSR